MKEEIRIGDRVNEDDEVIMSSFNQMDDDQTGKFKTKDSDLTDFDRSSQKYGGVDEREMISDHENPMNMMNSTTKFMQPYRSNPSTPPRSKYHPK